ncbi:putative hydroxypyruvate isomerase isoform X2 [Brachionichthys hirsutus]|uniref:putative hydroxypyruvate isomerase isoform X2 n=1 Tax=Brachionichthys hirsutus TaxID=412623 RepID=UPI0036043315
MAPLKFCANLSWLFTELPDFSQRIFAAAAAGFQAVEAAWLYESDLQELQRAQEATGVEVVLINTPPGDAKAGDSGLGAVPERETDFREGLQLALKYATGLGCKRIHLMAGRVPVGSHRREVAQEMEDVFVQNLKYAADVLLKHGITGFIEPINTRLTDPTYFLDSPHQAVAILEKVGKPNIKLQMVIFRSPRFQAGMSLTVLGSSTTATSSVPWRSSTTRDTSGVNTSHSGPQRTVWGGSKIIGQARSNEHNLPINVMNSIFCVRIQ